MSKEVYITHKYVKEIEHSEIDFDLPENVLGREVDTLDIRNIFVSREGKWWTGEGEPMEIDKVIKTLNELKDKGANYVEMMYHCDHIGYVFNGVDIHESTKEELEAHLEGEKKKNERARQEEIEKLERKLKELKS